MARAPVAALALLLAASVATAQDPPPSPPTPTPGPAAPPEGGDVQGGPPKTNPPTVPGTIAEVFPQPTDEDWKKPCLLKWERTWEDALAVSQETRKPILICVSMDGEPASEHYAGKRYRDPEIARLYEPYVCVIASVYRHADRDFDDAGNRVPCPRFGGVTCGEHIAIEPILYAKYFDGDRVAPRHICIETDGTEMYDVFYANDVTSVLTTLKDQISERKEKPRTVVRGDRPVAERVASRAVEDRAAVEAAYRTGDAAVRRAILEAAARSPDTAPLEVLRLALFGTDPEMARLARVALAASTAPEATPLLNEALKTAMEPAERSALVAALERLGAKAPRARWLAAAHRGLGAKSTAIDVKQWLNPGSDYSTAAANSLPPEVRDAVDLAERALDEAMEEREAEAGEARSSRMIAGLKFEDARLAAVRAEEAGGAGWRTKSVLALCAYYTGKPDDAYALSEGAVRLIPPGDGTWKSMAVLTVFAEGRWKAIKAAVRAKKEYPPSWLADLHSVYSVLLRHPRCTDARVDWHCELLTWLGVKDQAARVLKEGLARFPDSDLLHARLRLRTLEERGPSGLLAAYEDLLKDPKAPAGLRPFAARAAVEAGDQSRRVRKPVEALEAYAKALALYGDRPDAAPAGAQILAGRARIAFEAGDDENALEGILASFAKAPGSAGDKDGLGFTPGETAKVVLARLKERKKDALAERLQKAMDALDQELLRPDRP